MRILGVVGGLILALAGAVFVLQGLNAPFAPHSFMTADPLWVVLGSLGVVGGLLLALGAFRRGAD